MGPIKKTSLLQIHPGTSRSCHARSRMRVPGAEAAGATGCISSSRCQITRLPQAACEKHRLMAKRNAGLDDSTANPAAHGSSGARPGGARRDRTDDLVLAKHALSQLSYGPVSRPAGAQKADLVGLGGLEPPTSRLSSARSNQLSYKPGRKKKSTLVHAVNAGRGARLPYP
jgi:hypothetical protein